jgi:hypothetical protein
LQKHSAQLILLAAAATDGIILDGNAIRVSAVSGRLRSEVDAQLEYAYYYIGAKN